jgi:aminoglycoside phosphotransferase (APT) family kinase protein
LHAVDVDAVGLGDLSRKDGYVERQLRRWSKQWAGSKTRELPVIDEVERRLGANVPEQHGVAIVHGDYRFGNCITDLAQRRIAAVLDWELCTLGDAMADLGHMSVYWHDPAAPLPMTNDPTSAAGFPRFDELLQRYATRTGRDVSLIGYYRAFAAWRLAIIAEGVAARHREHHPDDTAALEASRASVQRLAESALASLGV